MMTKKETDAKLVDIFKDIHKVMDNTDTESFNDTGYGLIALYNRGEHTKTAVLGHRAAIAGALGNWGMHSVKNALVILTVADLIREQLEKEGVLKKDEDDKE